MPPYAPWVLQALFSVQVTSPVTSIEPKLGTPQWTERLYPPGGGLDHLGLGSVVTDRILPMLVPGINVLTVHPRYWAFYSFVLSEFWRRELPRTRANWKRFFETRECLFAVACHLCEDSGHIGNAVGSQRIKPLIERGDREFDPQFTYVKSDFGGYGLYYASVMEQLGLVLRANPTLGLPVDTVTPVGQEIAGAYREAIHKTTYYRDWFESEEDPVPREVLEEYASVGCYCRLRQKSAPDRQLLGDAFLHSGESKSAAARRSALRMVISVLDQTEGFSIPSVSFRRIMYYRQEWKDEGWATIKYQPRDKSVSRQWRLYQAREYFNFGLNQLWQWLNLWGLSLDGDVYPIELERVETQIRSLDLKEFSNRLDLSISPPPSTSSLADLVDWIRSLAKVRNSMDDEWPLNKPLTEDAIVRLFGDGENSTAGSGDLGVDVAAALVLLLLVAARLWPAEWPFQYADDWFPVSEGHPDRVPLDRFVADIRKSCADNTTIRDALLSIIQRHVIDQHERAAFAKLPFTGDTFRFRREAGRLRVFRRDARFGMNDSRYEALAIGAYELGWVGSYTNTTHKPTPEGRRLLEKGDLPSTGRLPVTT